MNETKCTYATHHEFESITNACSTRPGGNSYAMEVIHHRILRVITVYDVFKNGLGSN